MAGTLTKDIFLSPQRSPEFVLHRHAEGIGGEIVAFVTKDRGILMQDYQYALIEVIPIDDANPELTLYFWSEEASAWITNHTAVTFAGKGVNVAWAAVIPVYGQRILIAFTGGPADGSTKVMVSGFHPDQV